MWSSWSPWSQPARRLAAGALVVLAAVFVVPVGATAAAAASAPAAAEPAGPAAGQAAEPVRILPLGDSITYGYEYGSYRAALWDLLVADGHRIDFVGSQDDGPTSLPDRDHEGHRGWRIAQITEHAPDYVEEHEPDVVLLHIGTNDLIQGASARRIVADLDDLLDALTGARPQMTVVVATLIPLHAGDARWRETNAGIARLVAERAEVGERILLADMTDGGPRPGRDVPDGVHPNADGYAAMARVWYPVVSGVLTSRDQR